MEEEKGYELLSGKKIILIYLYEMHQLKKLREKVKI